LPTTFAINAVRIDLQNLGDCRPALDQLELHDHRDLLGQHWRQDVRTRARQLGEPAQGLKAIGSGDTHYGTRKARHDAFPHAKGEPVGDVVDDESLRLMMGKLAEQGFDLPARSPEIRMLGASATTRGKVSVRSRSITMTRSTP
jgi:hypothetical protein